MIRLPPRSTRTDTLLPYTTLFRSDFENYGGRASLLWTPDANLRVRLSALAQNLYVDAPSIVEADPATLEPFHGGLTQSEYLPTFSNVKYRLYNATIDYDLGPATLTSARSEEHTSELQSLMRISYAVFCLK